MRYSLVTAGYQLLLYLVEGSTTVVVSKFANFLAWQEGLLGDHYPAFVESTYSMVGPF
jgi:hypothetical protein